MFLMFLMFMMALMFLMAFPGSLPTADLPGRPLTTPRSGAYLRGLTPPARRRQRSVGKTNRRKATHPREPGRPTPCLPRVAGTFFAVCPLDGRTGVPDDESGE